MAGIFSRFWPFGPKGATLEERERSNDALADRLAGQAERACAIQEKLCATPALGPENGGQGELARAALIEELLAGAGVSDISRVDSADPRVESGIRPNIVARIPGEGPKTLWLFSHMDTVPPGQGWSGDPYVLRRDGDQIYGRGVEDNQQAITSSLLLAESLLALGVKPKHNLGLVFMADEECGSAHGLRHILAARPELFGKGDLFVAPDGGASDGSEIEIAEKAQLWLKITVTGKQCHASQPQDGVNALVAASSLIVDLALGLPGEFPERNELFSPPISTFTPTRHDGNGPAINIVPGVDVFYLDCRLLPGLSPDMALKRIEDMMAAQDLPVAVGVEVVQRQEASATSEQSPVVIALKKAIKAVYDVDARAIGIGGATVAAFLRQKGFPAAVWSCLAGTCHMPNERSSLRAACEDAQVFARVLMDV